ncbi:nicotinamide riboside transporter PnuC [Secundilactobacillus folii]|nr:nicotinamide riboside transporter PnuC [Secundilactobacillus folii]
MKEKFQGNYLQWIMSELKGWQTIVWAIFAFGFGFQTNIWLSSPITLLTTITYVATLVGLLCTCAMAAGKAINGLLGFISAFGFIYVNWTAGHYASVLDQLIFVVLIDAPLMFTWKTWGQRFQAKVKSLNGKGYVVSIIGMLIAWAILYPIYVELGDSNPVWDSLVLAIGATASLLCTLHFAQQADFWFGEDLFNIVLWFTALQGGYSQAALAMLVSTLMYFSTAVYSRFFSPWHEARVVIKAKRQTNTNLKTNEING